MILKNSTLQGLIQFVLVCWHEQKSEVPEHISPYFNFHDEIGTVDGVLLKVNRIIIPETLREHVLRQLHTGHIGIETCQLSTHKSVYW